MAETLTVTVDDGNTYSVDVRGISLFTDQGLTTPATFPAAVSAQTTWYAAAPTRVGRRDPIEVVAHAADGTLIPIGTFNSLPATVNLTEGSVDLSGPSSSGGSSAPCEGLSAESDGSVDGGGLLTAWSVDAVKGTSITLDVDTSTFHLKAGVYFVQVCASGGTLSGAPMTLHASPYTLGYDGVQTGDGSQGSAQQIVTMLALATDGTVTISAPTSTGLTFAGIDIFRVGDLAS